MAAQSAGKRIMQPDWFERDVFLLRQGRGGVEHPIEVFDDADTAVAYIRFAARPARGCLTIFVSVITFFAFPVAAIWVLGLVCGWIEVVNPMDIDRQPITVPIVVLMLIVALGFLATMFVASLVHPKRLAGIYTDRSCREALLHVQEDRKSKYNSATLTVTDATQAVVGHLRQNRRNKQVDLLHPDGQTFASFCPSENATPAEWTPAAVLTLLLGVFIGLATSFFYILVPQKEKRFTKSVLWRPQQQAGEPYIEIGTIVFDPQKEFPYEIRLTADPDNTLDRRLVVALGTLLDW